jgi:hypothetical protein
MTAITEKAHALFSASKAPAWMRCAPMLACEVGKPDSSSEFADEGTAAHELGAKVLERGEGAFAKDHLDDHITVGERVFVVDDDMAGHVQTYVDRIRARIQAFYDAGAVNVQLLVEVRVDYSAYIGHPDAFGTSDVVLIVEWADGTAQIDVGDLKYGMGVQVYASQLIEPATFGEQGNQLSEDVIQGNEQMMLYALGAYDQYSSIYDFKKISMAIYQPRLNHFDEYECDVDELLAFAARARAAADQARLYLESPDTPIPLWDFTPGKKQCRWCKVKGSCNALTQSIIHIVSQDFEDLSTTTASAAALEQRVKLGQAKLHDATEHMLDVLYPNLDLVEIWLKGVRGEIEKRALAGAAFETCKLVQGKKGNRKFGDEVEAERLMKSFRLKVEQMYKLDLISVAVAEKLLKDQPKRWAKLKALITQTDGALSVAPISDKRPAVVVTPVGDDFDAVPDATGEESEFV